MHANGTKRPLVVMWHTSAILPRFIEGVGERDLYLAYGEEVPDFDACYWMSGRYAARRYVSGIPETLIAPGPHWLGTVDEALLGRKIHITPLEDLPTGVLGHIKPAQVKVNDLPAGIYFSEHYRDIANDLGVDPSSLTQWTDTLLELNHEHRFYALDGQVVTGSPYLVDGQVYVPGFDSAMSKDAEAFARDALAHLGDNAPPAFTLDVGFDQVSRSWVIVEANPAWSSGMYGANMAAVVATIDRACAFDARWAWKPDVELLRQGRQMPTMRAMSPDKSSTILSVSTDR